MAELLNQFFAFCTSKSPEGAVRLTVALDISPRRWDDRKLALV
jgi:hypothetical protein